MRIITLILCVIIETVKTKPDYEDGWVYKGYLEIQTCCEYNCIKRAPVSEETSKTFKDELTVSFDFDLSLFHLLEQLRVSNNASSIPNLPTRLVQPGNTTYNGPFRNIRKFRNLFKRLNADCQAKTLPQGQQDQKSKHSPSP